MQNSRLLRVTLPRLLILEFVSLQLEACARIWELETNLRLLEFMVDSAIASQPAPELSGGSAEPRVEPPASSVPSTQGSGDIEEFCAESGSSHQGVPPRPKQRCVSSPIGAAAAELTVLLHILNNPQLQQPTQIPVFRHFCQLGFYLASLKHVGVQGRGSG